MPAFLATMGVAASVAGIIEGVSDGLSSFAKMASGYYTDRLQRRKSIAVIGYLVTAFGTAAFGLATAASHVLIARACAWLGRGVRTPVRKALLAGSVTKETYGRAFGFERMMDTLGAIVGPASAFFLLGVLNQHYAQLFALTLIPGLLAVAMIVFVVKERNREPVPHISFNESLRALPCASDVFSLRSDYLAQAISRTRCSFCWRRRNSLPDSARVKRRRSLPACTALLHNIFYAAFSMIAGWLADRFSKSNLLALGYSLAALMAAAIMVLPLNVWTLAVIFLIGGVYVAIEETLEDSLCAELVGQEHHGIAFGTLATVNGIGDFYRVRLWARSGQPREYQSRLVTARRFFLWRAAG